MAFPSQPKLSRVPAAITPLSAATGARPRRGGAAPGLRARPFTGRPAGPGLPGGAEPRGALSSSDEPSPKRSIFSPPEASPVPHRSEQAVPAEHAPRGCAEQSFWPGAGGGQPGSPCLVWVGYAENAELCLGCGHQCAYRPVILVSVALQ